MYEFENDDRYYKTLNRYEETKQLMQKSNIERSLCNYLSKHEKETILKIWTKCMESRQEDNSKLPGDGDLISSQNNHEKIQKVSEDLIKATNAVKSWISKNKLAKHEKYGMKTNMGIFKKTNTYINIEELISGICEEIKETTKEKHKYSNKMGKVIEYRKSMSKEDLAIKKNYIPEHIQK